ncbi:hypothetical protein P3875_04185 [Myroides sp. JBRI-B21084]|uniref:hypothetical protein n=1 Tax=Myroides sp. JBRI-B21084 TaxID=3119977 RepID=UPI0026E19E44|nr:hypothetical protein [Paenimyroides cloacae]WKW47271.1 hypothetical protein P3875_04185 [Paenimyroides cloacae]
MTQLEISLKTENEKLANKLKRMQQLSTRDKFYNDFFKNCNKYKTRKEAFDSLNIEYANLFGEQLFTNYKSFQMYYLRKTVRK